MLCPRVLLIDLYIFDPMFDPVFSVFFVLGAREGTGARVKELLDTQPTVFFTSE